MYGLAPVSDMPVMHMILVASMSRSEMLGFVDC